MIKSTGTTLLLLLLVGCGTRNSVVVYGPVQGQRAANLLLGPSPDHTRLAELHAYRSSWPSVSSGYLFDDVSTYTEVIYDDQSFYDWQYGGGYTREAVSVRTGVLVR